MRGAFYRDSEPAVYFETVEEAVNCARSWEPDKRSYTFLRVVDTEHAYHFIAIGDKDDEPVAKGAA